MRSIGRMRGSSFMCLRLRTSGCRCASMMRFKLMIPSISFMRDYCIDVFSANVMIYIPS